MPRKYTFRTANALDVLWQKQQDAFKKMEFTNRKEMENVRKKAREGMDDVGSDSAQVNMLGKR